MKKCTVVVYVFMIWAEWSKIEKKLPTSFIYCPPEAMLKTHVMKDEHAPDKFRVRGPLSNSQKFAETWGCPLESSMNPSQK